MRQGEGEPAVPAVKYVRYRDGVLTYERRVPTAVIQHPEAWARHFEGKRLWRKSLRTKLTDGPMFAAAEAVDADYVRRQLAAMNEIRGGTPTDSRSGVLVGSPRLVRARRPVTQHDLDVIEDNARHLEAKELKQLYARADGDSGVADVLAEAIERYEMDAADRREAIMTPGWEDDARPWLPSPTRDAKRMVEALGLDADPSSSAFGMVVAAIRRGHLAGAHDIGELLAGRAKPMAMTKPRTGNVELFSEAVASYLGHKTLAPRTAREIQTACDELISLVGDKPLVELTKADFESFVEFRASRMVGGKARDAVARPASAATISKNLTLLRAAIGHAIDHKAFAFDGPNPASRINVEIYAKDVNKAVMPDKRPFKVGELNAVFRHPWFTGCAGSAPAKTHQAGEHRLEGAEYWVPIVALFTGCRVAELGGLRLSEVCIDDPHPHLAVRDNEHRRTKGGYARDVPILDALFEIGFYAYVERVRAAGADRLFPDWTPPTSRSANEAAWYNSRIIKAFNRTVIPARLGDGMVAGARRDVTFHSFRGAFKTLLQATRYGLHPNLVNEVVGHAKDQLDRRYVGKVPLEETYPAVRSCNYDGLILPRPPG